MHRFAIRQFICISVMTFGLGRAPGLAQTQADSATYVSFIGSHDLSPTQPQAINFFSTVTGDAMVPIDDGFFIRQFNGNSIELGSPCFRSWVTGITLGGATVGYCEAWRGFTRSPTGTMTMVDCPGPIGATWAWGINDQGDITGFCADATAPSPAPSHGFLLSQGTYTLFDPPGSTSTYPAVINDTGTIAGYYYDASNVQHGFVRRVDGSFVSFDVPGTIATLPLGQFWPGPAEFSMNAAGVIAGTYMDAQGVSHGFIRSGGGAITTFDFPGASATVVNGINAWGTIAGFYLGPLSISHGYVRSPLGVYTSFDPITSTGTTTAAINDLGVETGSYTTPPGGPPNTGFLRVPKLVRAVGNGTNIPGFSGDGANPEFATLATPGGVAVDGNGDLYVADTGNHRIRKVTFGTAPTEPFISTVAGNGVQGFSGDGGNPTAASLNAPFGVAVDAAGDLYIADTGNDRIRKVTFGATPVITTVAGGGGEGFCGDGGAPTSACLFAPFGVAVDASFNVYIADTINQRIRKVTSGPSPVITTVAGNGAAGFSGDGGPAVMASLCYPSGVAVDVNRNLYIGDTNNNRIRMVRPPNINTIDTVAGNGSTNYGGDGSEALNSGLNGPGGVSVDANGNIWFADTYASVVRVLTPGPDSLITTAPAFVEAPTIASAPLGVAVDSHGTLYVADTGHSMVLSYGQK